MKKFSITRIFALSAFIWSSFSFAPHAISQTATGQQRTHGVNAPGTNIGPSPDQGQVRDDNDINAKNPAAGVGPASNSAPSDSGTPSDNAPSSDLRDPTQNQETGGIWPFALPIAAIMVGVPLALMFMMRRSKSK
ncbi:MAG TPA: hypothetical protein VGB45_08510 [Abditibacterium sp.]|jgi:hypothetical protein